MSCYDNISLKVKNCNKKQTIYFDKCIDIAQHSNLTHKHGCIIVYNNEIISAGHNYKEKKLNNLCSVHAEISALKNVKKKLIPKCELYVVRLGPNEKNYNLKEECNYLKYSKPCSVCTEYLNKFNIKKVFYSINN